MLGALLLALYPGGIASHADSLNARLRLVAAESWWLITGILTLEPVLGIDGLGTSLWAGVVVVPVLVCVLLSVVAFLSSRQVEQSLRVDQPRWILPALLIVVFGLSIWGSLQPFAQANPTAAYEQRSSQNPLGTDYAGRDVLHMGLIVQPATLTATAAAALLTGLTAAAIHNRLDIQAIRALGPPALWILALVFLLGSRSWILGLFATAALALPYAATHRFSGGVFVAFHTLFAVSTLLPLPMTLGGLYAGFPEFLAVAHVVSDSRFLWQMAYAAAASVPLAALVALMRFTRTIGAHTI
ncbi:MAG: hypothetical protein ACFB51_14365 [Anaerolineae bacterium]